MTLHPVYHNEMVNREYLHQPGTVPTRLDQFITVLFVYENGTSRVRGEKGNVFKCLTRQIREIPRIGAAVA